MSTTDSIADMLTRIRNANTANKETVSMPSSRKLVEIARIMKEEGYIAEYEIISKAPQDELFITLKYGDKKEMCIRDSAKPGRSCRGQTFRHGPSHVRDRRACASWSIPRPA